MRAQVVRTTVLVVLAALSLAALVTQPRACEHFRAEWSGPPYRVDRVVCVEPFH